MGCLIIISIYPFLFIRGWIRKVPFSFEAFNLFEVVYLNLKWLNRRCSLYWHITTITHLKQNHADAQHETVLLVSLLLIAFFILWNPCVSFPWLPIRKAPPWSQSAPPHPTPIRYPLLSPRFTDNPPSSVGRIRKPSHTCPSHYNQIRPLLSFFTAFPCITVTNTNFQQSNSSCVYFQWRAGWEWAVDICSDWPAVTWNSLEQPIYL